jgi:hypothetical protein
VPKKKGKELPETSRIKRPTKKVKQGLFLSAFALTGIILDAAQSAGVDRRMVNYWKEDPEFLARFTQAEKDAEERLEREAYRRAHQGTRKPVFYQGEECGAVHEYSDTLLMFLMKGRNPKKWRDNTLNLGNAEGKPLKIAGTLDVFATLSGLSDDELDRAIEDRKRALGYGGPQEAAGTEETS